MSQGHDAYGACLVRLGIDDPTSQDDSMAEALLKCVTASITQHHNETQAKVQEHHDFARDLYMILAAALVFFMQAGFAMVCAGSVRRKNLQNTMLKNLLDACWASVGFWSVGYAFAFGDRAASHNAFLGTDNFFLMNVDDYAFWLFQYTFSAAAATIVAGTLAERCKMVAYIAYSVVVSGFVYPIVVHAVWSDFGFLSVNNNANRLFDLPVGVVDFAGCGVVHITGGAVALVATNVLGPRRGRFNDELTGEPLQNPMKIPGHSVSLQMVGTLILWFCWYGFNSGSALLLADSQYQSIIAAVAAVNTTLSAGSAGIVALMTNMIVMDLKHGKALYDLDPALNGALSGLVAITGACGVVQPWAAVVIGTIAGWIYLLGSWMLPHLRIDDAVNGIPIHMMNGMWGLIAVGLFADTQRIEQAFGDNILIDGKPPSGLIISMIEGQSNLDARLLQSQLVATIFILLWSCGIMYPFFVLLSRQGLFRSAANEEVMGLDRSFHGGRNNDTLTIQQITIYKSLLETTIKKKKRQKRLRRTSSAASTTTPSISSTEMKQLQNQARQIALGEQETSSDEMRRIGGSRMAKFMDAKLQGDDADGSLQDEVGKEDIMLTNHGSINTINEEEEGDDGAVSDIGSSDGSLSLGGFKRIDMTGDMLERRSTHSMD